MLGFECLSFRRPSNDVLESCAEAAVRVGPNHNWPYATKDAPPIAQQVLDDRFVVNHSRVQVGTGKATYHRACDVLKGWKHIELGWVGSTRPEMKIGALVGFRVQSLYLWNRLPLQVVYVKKGHARLPSYPSTGQNVCPAASIPRGLKGEEFAVGCTTLQGHQLAGEEKFSVQWNKKDNSVWYEIYSFSKPACLLAKVTYPIVRLHQRKFAKDSMRAFKQALEQ